MGRGGRQDGHIAEYCGGVNVGRENRIKNTPVTPIQANNLP